MLLVLLLSSLAFVPLHYICWNSTRELLSDASIAACYSNRWLKPTGAIVLWPQSLSYYQGPPRDSSLAWEIETSSLQLIMLDSLDILVMTFPTVYPLVYFEAWQYALEVSAKQTLKEHDILPYWDGERCHLFEGPWFWTMVPFFCPISLWCSTPEVSTFQEGWLWSAVRSSVLQLGTQSWNKDKKKRVKNP